ncbi:MAG: nitronate monooxygenase [Desulfobacteraceae bacterium]|nr:nitronate monooxygenase [Desulfobacteraceae bacterium]
MELPQLQIGHFIARVPIIQGGMGIGVSLSGLASAVANEGGIGIIAGAMIGMSESDIVSNPKEANIRALRREIRQARSKTDGIIGVNIMVALTQYSELVTTAIEEKIDIIFSGAGLPLDLPKYLEGTTHTKLVPIVSSGRAAQVICKKWARYNYVPDGFVVEGPMAGGHLGLKKEQIYDPNFSLEILVPEVIEAVRPFEEKHHRAIPVIAAGGIYTGADIYKFLKMGAAGVQMATRFVATHECDADMAFKQAFIDAKEEDITIIESPVGLPGRAIKNEFLDAIKRGEKVPFTCPYHCITTCDYKTSPYCISRALINAKRGKLKHGFAFVGQNAYRVNRMMSVKELMDELKEEFYRCQENV